MSRRAAPQRIPAFIVAGTASGSGKTVITLGIIEALRSRGLRVQAFKAGPDYIDPGLHRAVLGSASYNLDTWMMGASGVRATFSRAAAGADCAVIEGAMGLYDGRGSGQEGSSAHLAKTLGVPVLLVAGADKASRSMGAVVRGFEEYDRGVDIRWVIFNRAGSSRHAALLEASVRRPSRASVIGCVARDEALAMEERHLGLVTAEDAPTRVRALARAAARAVEGSVDLESLLKGPLVRVGGQGAGQRPVRPCVKVAVARDEAFSFYYQENLDILEESGAELAFFSPLRDRALPEGAAALYLGGGYPELCAERLEANAPLRGEIRALALKGMPIYAECGGLMYLGRSIRKGVRGLRMAGVFPWSTRLLKRRKALGYREAVFTAACPFAGRGRARGHEFHYSEMASAPAVARAYLVKGADEDYEEGFTSLNALASYLHLHFASSPGFARGFVGAAKKFSSGG